MGLNLDVKGKPWYFGAIIGVILMGVIITLTVMFVVKPQQQKIVVLEKKLQELQAKVAEGQSAAAQLPKFQEEIAKLEKELTKLIQVLPTKKETHVILKKIKSLADAGDFGFKAFTPSPTLVDKDFYYQWPITVQLDGNYHNLAIFFDRLRNFPRIINIGDMELKADKKQQANATLQAKFQLLTYVYKEPEEGAAQ
jgi:type IV pilus assembly protein PilO